MSIRQIMGKIWSFAGILPRNDVVLYKTNEEALQKHAPPHQFKYAIQTSSCDPISHSLLTNQLLRMSVLRPVHRQ